MLKATLQNASPQPPRDSPEIEARMRKTRAFECRNPISQRWPDYSYAEGLMNTLQAKGKGSTKITRLDLVGWFVDEPAFVEVRVRDQPDGRSTLDRIPENNHGVRVLIRSLNADNRSGLWPKSRLSYLRCRPDKDKVRCVCSLSTMRKTSAEQLR